LVGLVLAGQARAQTADEAQAKLAQNIRAAASELAHGKPTPAQLQKACALLGEAGAALDRSRLYEPALESSNLELTHFDEPARWLEREFKRTQALLRDVAPLVQALGRQPPCSGLQLDFWVNSLEAAQLHAQPGDTTGSAALLERFVAGTLASLGRATCDRQRAGAAAPARHDLFAERQRRLAQTAQLRCQESLMARAVSAYGAVAARFNRELAGRYPFGPLEAPDASLAATKAFFQDYAAEAEGMEPLRSSKLLRQQSARQFVLQLDRVAAFFRHTLAMTISRPVGLSVRFRAWPRLSVGADQVVSWQLVSERGAAGYPNRPTQMDWYFQDSLALQLSWAEQSRVRPTASDQRDLAVDGHEASFIGPGTWGLLRLMEVHRTTTTEPYDPIYQQATLEFAVPLSPQPTAHLFVAVGLRAIDPDTQREEPLQ
jgi:type VI secretion system protein ImpL